MAFEIQGTIELIEDTQNVTDTFQKREFVLKVDTEGGGRTFTEFIKFQTIQDRCALLDKFRKNDEVNVHFNIKGRKWENKGKVSYFNNLEAWRIESVSGKSGGEPPFDPDFPPYEAGDAPEDDPLPF